MAGACVWRQLSRARRVALPTARAFCSPPPAPEEPKDLMNFPRLVWPSLYFSVRNWIFSNFIIRPHLDHDFNMQDFVAGSKQAVETISEVLGDSNFNSLQELVSKEAYEELRDSVSQLSMAEREQLYVNKDDIYLCFPYQVGIMFEENERRWVEITMCYHVLRGLNELKSKTDTSQFSLGYNADLQKHSLQICNYRFIREYTKGVTDSNWLVNIVNHFALPGMPKKDE